MKRAFVSLSVLTLLLGLAASAGIAAQNAASAKAKSEKTKAYACPKCEMATAKAGTCACGEELIAVKGRIAYVCEHCIKEHAWSSRKPGNCPMCKGELHKVLITYACEACKVSSAKPGDCKMCSGSLKKHILPYH